jgi:hypothetical protein
MNAKTRDLALLAALSLFCAGVAWISDHFVLGFGLFRVRRRRRSWHSREALALTWTS